MALAKAPSGFFVCNQGDANFLVWEKVYRDINNLPIQIVGYNIYKTANPNGVNWGSPYGVVDTSNNYTDADVFFLDYTTGDFIYKVCPVDNLGNIGLCAEGYGIVAEGQVTIPDSALWDISGWDISTWA